MPKNKLLFVYNPYAGRKDIVNHLHYILNYYTSLGFHVVSRPTQKDNDVFEYIKENGSHFSYIVIAGGDGTLNEAIQGLMLLECDHQPRLGYIPCGSTNDYANSRGIPLDIKSAARQVFSGEPQFIDIGQLNGRHFAYVAAFGLFTDVTYDTSQTMKNIFGHSAYLLEGVKRLGSIESYSCNITCDDETFTEDILLGVITNSASVGGFTLPVNPNEKGNDTGFNLILLKYAASLFNYQGVASALLGVREPGEQFIIRPVNNKVTISCNKAIPWTLDGEYGGSYTDNQITLHKEKVKLILP